MLLLLLLFKAWENIKLRCLKIIIKNYTISSQLKYHAIQTRRCKTLHNPQPTQLLQQAHMMSHITCQLRFFCWVHVSFAKLSSLPSSLFSPLSSCLVQVACDVILPAVLFPHWSVLSIIQLPCTRCMLYHPASWFVPLYSVQHCAPINVKLSQSTTFVVASC